MSGLERIWGTRPLIQILDRVMTLKTFAVLIVIFFYSDHDNYAIHRIFKESGGVDVAKKGELLLR